MLRSIHRKYSARRRRPRALVAACCLLLAGWPPCTSGGGDAAWRQLSRWLASPAEARERKESRSSEQPEKEGSSKEESSGHHEDSGDGSKDSESQRSDVSQPDTEDRGERGRRETDSEGRAYYRGGDKGDEDGRPPRTIMEMLERALGPGKSDKAHSGERRSASSTGAPLAPVGGRSYINDEVLAVNLSQRGVARAQSLGFRVQGGSRLPHGGGSVTRLRTPPGMGALKARDMLMGRAPGEQFALNQIYRPYHVANKDMRAETGPAVPAGHGGLSTCTPERCYPRQLIRWHDAVQPCARGLRVGVIDTHIDQHHPAFSRAKLSVGGFLPDGRQAAPDWHGTGVLALLAGDPDSGTPGLIPNASFYVASVFFEDSEGEVATDTVSVLGALEWMEAFDVKVINMSFSGPKDPLVEKAIEEMSRRGVIFVAAAGNDGPTTEPAYPAAYKPVIAVTAVSRDLRNYPYASRGDRIDIAAPGVDIWSAVPHAREGFHTGTSFAAPYVTAILATLYNGMTPGPKDELLDRLPVMDLGPSGRDPIYGRGLALAPAKCGLADGTVAQVPEQPEPRIPRQPPAGWGASIAPDGTAAFR